MGSNERIEAIDNYTQRGVDFKELLFRNGPGDFLCRSIADELMKVPQFKKLFGDAIDGYRRMDYAFRNLPALRIYSNAYAKEYESWFIEGDVVADIILPASLRREETELLANVVATALLQQFRRTAFFNVMCERVPALNELGKKFAVDKNLAFEWGENEVPLTQLTVNFRIDLRVWDQYLVENLRTKDDPFEETLAELKRIVSEIQGLNDEGDLEVSVPLDQTLTNKSEEE